MSTVYTHTHTSHPHVHCKGSRQKKASYARLDGCVPSIPASCDLTLAHRQVAASKLFRACCTVFTTHMSFVLLLVQLQHTHTHTHTHTRWAFLTARRAQLICTPNGRVLSAATLSCMLCCLHRARVTHTAATTAHHTHTQSLDGHS